MKRLLLSSLMSCMLMSQLNAGSLITQDNAIALAKGAGLALAPLALRGVAAMRICSPVEHEYNLAKDMPTSLRYLLPHTNIVRRAKEIDMSIEYLRHIATDSHPIPQAEATTIKLNKFTAFISVLMCGASIAKLCGFLPESVSKFMGSQITTAGIATGSALSCALLWPSFARYKVPLH